jgi:hypothetical protein
VFCANDGASCLYVAAEKGNLDVVVFLTSHLHSSAAKKLLLMRKHNMSTCLHASAKHGHILITRYLLKIGGHELLYMKENSGASCRPVRIGGSGGQGPAEMPGAG